MFKKYEESFPDLFEKEKERLSKYLTGYYQIEHFGSTAVPGLGGKGIIDIYIVSPISNHESIKKALVAAGYETRPGFSPSQHVSFRIELPDPIEKERRYHVHLGELESKDFKKCIKFRNFLLNHPEDAEKYAQIKKKASAEANQDRVKYMDIKSPFIEEILNKSLI